MAITVNPPVQTNEVTGEVEARPESDMIVSMGEHVEQNTHTHAEPTDTRFDPDFVANRKARLTEPAFHDGDPDVQIAFWNRSAPLTQDEIDQVQDVYMRTGDEQTPRLLAYKLTGDPDVLMPDDYGVFGLDPQQVDAPSEYLSPDEIDHQILTTEDSPHPFKANKILQANIGNSNAATVVQHLAHQYYSGQMSASEAYYKASSSGVPQAELYQAWVSLGDAVGVPFGRREPTY